MASTPLGKKQAEEAARMNRQRTKRRLAAERTAWRDKYRRWRKFSFFNVYIYLFALFVQLPFSSLSCAGLSWLPLPLVSFPFVCPLPTPNRPCQSKRSPKARHEADSFEPAEWSEWLRAVRLARRCRRRFDPRFRSFSLSSTSIFCLLLQRLYLSLRAVHSAAIFFLVLCRFVLAASSACFFSLFLPPPNPQSTVSVWT